ncbi:hypothetical protein IJI99_00210 [bacterium]|nr:hypothetical protein [bacterium]
MTKKTKKNAQMPALKVSWLTYNWPLVALMILIVACLLAGSFAYDFMVTNQKVMLAETRANLR